MLETVNSPGVILYSKRNWNQHLQKVIRKTQTIFALVSRTCDKKLGLKPEMFHWLYTRAIRPFILHGVLVWWPNVMQKTTKNQLGNIQRMVCLTITGAMNSSPNCSNSDASETDSVRSVDHGELRMTLYRLHILMQPVDFIYSSWDAIHLEKRERPQIGHAVRSHNSSLSLLLNLQGHY